MRNEQRIQEIARLGYDDDEAAFLCLVALHGGYFLSRQYPDFVGKQRGRCVTNLVNKALASGHCRTHAYRHNRMVYHLFSKPFYKAIGEEDNRNRRERRVFTIKNKLMCLDFVLANRRHQFLATESEKLEYFEGQLGIDRSCLPTRRYQSRTKNLATDRYFVDKFPIFIPSEENSERRVHFCFVDEGVVSGPGFETYLRQYLRLFGRLKKYSLIYVGTGAGSFDKAEQVFTRICGGGSGRHKTPVDPQIRRLNDHFRDRQLFESREFRSFNQDRLIRFRADRQEFNGDNFDHLFSSWKAEGPAAIIRQISPEADQIPTPTGALTRHVLPYDYNLFGSVHHVG